MKKLLLSLTIILLVFIAAESCKKKTTGPCDTTSCGTGKICVNGTCVCDSVHDGANCETEKRTRYLGSSIYTVECSSIHHFDYIAFLKSDSGANKIKIVNLQSQMDTTIGTLLTDGTIFIPHQSNTAGTLSGSASFINDKIVVSFIIDKGISKDTCVWTEN